MRYPITIRPVDTVRFRTRFVVRDADNEVVATLEHDSATDPLSALRRRLPRLRVCRDAEFLRQAFEIRWNDRDDTPMEFVDADGQPIGGIDANTSKRGDPARPLKFRRANGEAALLLYNRRAHTHRLLRGLTLMHTWQWSLSMGSWDIVSFGAFILGKTDFTSSRPNGTAVMSGSGRLLSMAGVTIRLHIDLDESEHELALLAAFSQAFCIAS